MSFAFEESLEDSVLRKLTSVETCKTLLNLKGKAVLRTIGVIANQNHNREEIIEKYIKYKNINDFQWTWGQKQLPNMGV